ncbi:MAG: 50S ribosomal protein L15 [Candidatus Kapaibacterium sp.]|nr:MAG: 50S ribosomal protein L15 [Candidatus Kapabacteria bacterium]
MKHVGNLTYSPGSRKSVKRIGRGTGSGHGGTSTKGHKGHQSRAGYKRKRSFEGGQMPLNRRLPKFGFKNPFRIEYQCVNVAMLEELAVAGKFNGGAVTFDVLHDLGIISKGNAPLKILGNGAITKALKVSAHKFSESAKAKIESAGGTVTVHE